MPVKKKKNRSAATKPWGGIKERKTNRGPSVSKPPKSKIGRPRTNNPDITRRLVVISDTSKRNVNKLSEELNIRNWRIIYCTLRHIPLEEILNRLNRCHFYSGNRMTYGIWVPLEPYQQVEIMAKHVRLPLRRVVDAIFQTIPKELVRHYFNQQLNMDASTLIEQENRRESKLLGERRSGRRDIIIG